MSSSNTPDSGGNPGQGQSETWFDQRWELIKGFALLREYDETFDLNLPEWGSEPDGGYKYLKGPNGKIITFGIRSTPDGGHVVDMYGILPDMPFFAGARTQTAWLSEELTNDELVSRLAYGVHRYEKEFAKLS